MLRLIHPHLGEDVTDLKLDLGEEIITVKMMTVREDKQKRVCEMNLTQVSGVGCENPLFFT